MTMNTKKRIKNLQKGFTLIELLIVITLLGAMAAIMLPSLSANRTTAMEAACDYNQAVTIKTLNNHYMLQGTLPNNLHTGTQEAVAAGYTLMQVPGEVGSAGTTADNLTNEVAVTALTANQAASLEAAGLGNVVSGDGSTVTAIATGVEVLAMNAPSAAGANDGFLADDENDITFNSHNLLEIMNPDDEVDDTDPATGNDSRDDGIVIPLFVSPATDWSVSNDGAWGAVAEVEAGAMKVGECRVPADERFAFYIAYVKAFSNRDLEGEVQPAILIGTSCPECGITNP